MVRPYSLDLRERVGAAAEAGQSCRTVADRFGVSVASVVKWRQRARARVARRPRGWAVGARCCWPDGVPGSYRKCRLGLTSASEG